LRRDESDELRESVLIVTRDARKTRSREARSLAMLRCVISSCCTWAGSCLRGRGSSTRSRVSLLQLTSFADVGRIGTSSTRFRPARSHRVPASPFSYADCCLTHAKQWYRSGSWPGQIPTQSTCCQALHLSHWIMYSDSSSKPHKHWVTELGSSSYLQNRVFVNKQRQ
jgi:hypothetical protein